MGNTTEDMTPDIIMENSSHNISVDVVDNQTLPNADFANFYALFEQPVHFDISQHKLDQRLRQLQKQYHPDNLAKHGTSQDESVISQTIQQSDKASALINQAYQTLSSPDSRAAYLLEMVDQAENLEQSIADFDFLDDAMTMRIDLDDAIESKNHSVLHELHPQIIERVDAQSKHFVKAYEHKDWQTAVDATQKLKFLIKLDADITTALDNVINAKHSDDDDLYV